MVLRRFRNRLNCFQFPLNECIELRIVDMTKFQRDFPQILAFSLFLSLALALACCDGLAQDVPESASLEIAVQVESRLLKDSVDDLST